MFVAEDDRDYFQDVVEANSPEHAVSIISDKYKLARSIEVL